MNRAIKFRIWDAPNLWMYEVDGFDQRFVIQLGGIVGRFNGKTYDTVTDSCVLMQFTGLTDKNGKEIYEGDIVCVRNNQNGFFQVVFVNAYVGGWVLKHDDDHYLLSLGARKQDEIEVIGNIHEHPDLI